MADREMNRLSLRVWTAHDGSRAVIQHLPPENGLGASMTLDDIRTELEFHDVTVGVRWDELEKALAQVLATGRPAQNVLAASASADDFDVYFGERESKLSRSESDQLLIRLEGAGKVLDRLSTPDVPIYFFRAESLLFKVVQSTHGLNIFGRPLGNGGADRLIDAGDGVAVVGRGGEMEYRASRSGYLVLKTDRRLEIRSPLFASEDKTRLEFATFPVSGGEESLLSELFDTLRARRDKDSTLEWPNREQITNKLHSGEIVRLLVRQGRPPIPPQDARLVFHVSEESTGKTDEPLTGNYRDHTPYREIDKDTLIAEKFPAREGIPGEDIYGAAIPIALPKEVSFQAGANVREEKGPECIRFYAASAGILRLEPKRASIMESFHIKGDAGPQTGNLRFSKDITVDGSLLSGYSIECGGNLIVKGCIENGARIHCKGMLTVHQGIFGQLTQVLVGGNAAVRFIQESVVRVQGDLTVKDYLYQSKVFCGGILRVEGKNMISADRGCVIGGKSNSFGLMFLHSAGSDAALTELFCGIDAEAHAKLGELRQLLPVLVRKISSLQRNLGFDPSSPDMVERIKAIPPVRRMQIKERLLQLKETTRQREEVTKKIYQLTEKAYAANAQSLYIEIAHHIIPKTQVRIGNRMVNVEKQENGIRFLLKGEEIFFQSLHSGHTK